MSVFSKGDGDDGWHFVDGVITGLENGLGMPGAGTDALVARAKELNELACAVADAFVTYGTDLNSPTLAQALVSLELATRSSPLRKVRL